MTKGWFLYLSGATLLQAVAGHADVQQLAFPVGIALGAAALAILFVLDREQGEHRWIRALRSSRMAGWLLALLTVGCIVGGSLPAESLARGLAGPPHPTAAPSASPLLLEARRNLPADSRRAMDSLVQRHVGSRRHGRTASAGGTTRTGLDRSG